MKVYTENGYGADIDGNRGIDMVFAKLDNDDIPAIENHLTESILNSDCDSVLEFLENYPTFDIELDGFEFTDECTSEFLSNEFIQSVLDLRHL